ncbi:hypothetical protein A9G41_04020 [Gilliamella sp. Nev5-1]|uniref:ribonuclease toxin immunity protein CdiI n=1 Tax=unclassified Gilliamella TaxID=2685620 RepID=UPI00080EA89C|nr:ribonuclease toxin immunity protein CdiI [Gilliamella apicola]OCG58373.1 hypothetical protein A9G40_09865 [Gilliamella apicola]OCG70943.1 hypothetical protein A9G41_04020 [Gilliamella apicola]
MTNNIQWLKKIEKKLIENDGGDLYSLLEIMYKEQKMNFLQFLYDASKGIGCSPSEGCGYALDQDRDNPEEFDEVSFMFGDYESSTISPPKFVELMQIISNSYIEAHPKDKDSIEFYMNKLRERYSK